MHGIINRINSCVPYAGFSGRAWAFAAVLCEIARHSQRYWRLVVIYRTLDDMTEVGHVVAQVDYDYWDAGGNNALFRYIGHTLDEANFTYEHLEGDNPFKLLDDIEKEEGIYLDTEDYTRYLLGFIYG